MFGPTTIIVASRMLELQAEAEANRLAKLAKQSKAPKARNSGRMAAMLTSLRSLLANPTEGPMPLPKLTDYPYRS